MEEVFQQKNIDFSSAQIDHLDPDEIEKGNIDVNEILDDQKALNYIRMVRVDPEKSSIEDVIRLFRVTQLLYEVMDDELEKAHSELDVLEQEKTDLAQQLEEGGSVTGGGKTMKGTKEVLRLRKENANLKKVADKFQDQIVRIQSVKETKEKQNAKLRKKVERLTKQNDTLTKTNVRKEREVQELQTRTTQFLEQGKRDEDMHGETEERILEMEEQIETQREQLADYFDAVKEHKKEIKTKNERIRELSDENRGNRIEIKELTNMNIELQNNLDAISEEFGGLKGRMEESARESALLISEENKEKLESMESAYSARIKDLETQLEERSKRAEVLEKENENLGVKVEKLEVLEEESREKALLAQTFSGTVDTETMDVIHGLEREKKELEERVLQLEIEVEDAKKEASTSNRASVSNLKHQREMDHLRKTTRGMADEIRKLKLENVNVREGKEKEQKVIDELQSAVAQYELGIPHASKEIRYLKEQIEYRDEQIKELKRLLALGGKELTENQLLLRMLMQKYDIDPKELATFDIKEFKIQMEEENKELKEEVKILNEDLKVMRFDLENKVRDMEKLQAKLEMMRKKMERAEEEKMNSMRRSIDEKNRKLDYLQRTYKEQMELGQGKLKDVCEQLQREKETLLQDLDRANREKATLLEQQKRQYNKEMEKLYRQIDEERVKYQKLLAERKTVTIQQPPKIVVQPMNEVERARYEKAMQEVAASAQKRIEEADVMRAQRDRTYGLNEELKEELADAKRQQLDLRDEVDLLRRRNEVMEKQALEMRNLVLDNGRLRNEKDSLEAHLELIQKRVAALTARLDSVVKLEREVEHYKAELKFFQDGGSKGEIEKKMKKQMGEIIEGYNELIEQKTLEAANYRDQATNLSELLIAEQHSAKEEIKKLQAMLKEKEEIIAEELVKHRELLEEEKEPVIRESGIPQELFDEIVQEKEKQMEILKQKNANCAEIIEKLREENELALENFRKKEKKMEEEIDSERQKSNEMFALEKELLVSKKLLEMTRERTNQKMLSFVKKSQYEEIRQTKQNLEKAVMEIKDKLVETKQESDMANRRRDEQLEHRMAKLTEKRTKTLNSMISKLKKKNDKLQSIIDSHVEELGLEKKMKEVMARESETKARVIERQYGQIRGLRVKLKRAQKDLDAYREGDQILAEKAQAKVEELEKRIHVLQMKSTTGGRSQRELTHLLTEKNKNYQKFKAQKQITQRYVKQEKEMHERNKAVVDELLQKVGNLEEENQKLERQVMEMSATIELFEKKEKLQKKLADTQHHGDNPSILESSMFERRKLEYEAKIASLEKKILEMEHKKKHPHVVGLDTPSIDEGKGRILEMYYNVKDELSREKISSHEKFSEVVQKNTKLKMEVSKLKKVLEKKRGNNMEEGEIRSQQDRTIERLENEQLSLKRSNMDLKFHNENMMINLRDKEMRIHNYIKQMEMVKKRASDRAKLPKKAGELRRLNEGLHKVIENLREESEKVKKSSISNFKYMEVVNKVRKLKKEKVDLKKLLGEERSKNGKAVKDLRVKVSSLLSLNSKSKKQSKKLKEKNEEKKRQLNEMESRTMQLEKEVENLKSNIERVKEVERTRSEIIASESGKILKAQLEKLETERDEMKKELILRTSEIEGLKKNVPQVSGKDQEQLGREVNYLKERIAQLNNDKKRLVAKNEQIDELMNNVSQLKAENVRLLRSNEELKDQLDQFDESFFDEIEDLKFNFVQSQKMIEVYKGRLRKYNLPVEVGL